MSLVPCWECGTPQSTTAKACSHCGANNPTRNPGLVAPKQPRMSLRWLIMIVIGLATLAYVLQSLPAIQGLFSYK